MSNDFGCTLLGRLYMHKFRRKILLLRIRMRSFFFLTGKEILRNRVYILSV